MISHRIRITAALFLALFGELLASLGCGASKAEVRAAEDSGYATDFARVYTTVLAVVRKRYPSLSENAGAGVIKTAWHEVRITAGNQDPPKNRTGAAPSLFDATAGIRKLYFVRFTVRVLGGDPWRVSIEGHASEWDRAAATPAELKGEEIPPWLAGRTNALRVAIHERLAKYAVELPDTTVKPKEQASAGNQVVVDASKFGNLPPGAAKAVVAVVTACKSRDFVALRANMRDDLVWSLGAEPGANDAVAMWQADTSVLGYLASVIEAGCRMDANGQQATCPPAYTEATDYLGYRVGFELGKDGVWKMTFFVSGD